MSPKRGKPPATRKRPSSGVVAIITEALPPTPCPKCGEPSAEASRTQDLVSGRVTVYTRCGRCGRNWQPAVKPVE